MATGNPMTLQPTFCYRCCFSSLNKPFRPFSIHQELQVNCKYSPLKATYIAPKGIASLRDSASKCCEQYIKSDFLHF